MREKRVELKMTILRFRVNKITYLVRYWLHARSRWSGIVSRVVALVAFIAAATTVTSGQDHLQPSEPISPTFGKSGTLFGPNGASPSTNISGIACRPAALGLSRLCLVIDDNGAAAQYATIEGRQLTAGEFAPIIGTQPSETTRGSPPRQRRCSAGGNEFADLDGEGVAWSAPFFYVSGSHGCKRKHDTFQLSSFILARFDIGAEAQRFGTAPRNVETTYRLSDALLAIPALRPSFAVDLGKKHDGLNVEGIAVVGDRLFAGLRAPAHDGAFLVGVPVSDLFAAGHGPLPPGKVSALRLALDDPSGEHAGIRDLSALPDGRVLILAGPPQKQDIPYSLWVIDPLDAASLRRVAILAMVPGIGEPAKAEAVVALGLDRVLVLFDGLENGGPREYAVSLR